MKKIILGTVISFLFFPLLASADGMFIPPPDRYIYETDQRAVIFYEHGMETLALSASFRGNASNFAWLVPTPTRPEVDKVSDELFVSLEDFTRPYYPDSRYGVDYGKGYYANEVLDQAVMVIETKQVGYYEITVLKSSDANELSAWLNRHNYSFPQNANYLLQSYIENEWYFTAVKIIDEYSNQAIENQLFEGHAQPLMLTFPTDRIVYPLKISGIDVVYSKSNPRVAIYGADYYIEQPNKQDYYVNRNSYYPRPPKQAGILIYVITDSRQTLPGFDTQYAGWIKGEEIKNLAFTDNGDPWLEPTSDKYFITKLYKMMNKSEMTNDLYLRQYDSNDMVNAPEWFDEKENSNLLFWLLIGISLFLTVMISGLIIFDKKK